MKRISLASHTEKHQPNLKINSVFCQEVIHNDWVAFTVAHLCKGKRGEILPGRATGLHRYENGCWGKCFIGNEAKAQGFVA